MNDFPVTPMMAAPRSNRGSTSRRAKAPATESSARTRLSFTNLGVPVHRVPQVVVESGLAADPHDWVPVNKKTLETRFPGVYAVGTCRLPHDPQ